MLQNRDFRSLFDKIKNKQFWQIWGGFEWAVVTLGFIAFLMAMTVPHQPDDPINPIIMTMNSTEVTELVHSLNDSFLQIKGYSKIDIAPLKQFRTAVLSATKIIRDQRYNLRLFAVDVDLAEQYRTDWDTYFGEIEVLYNNLDALGYASMVFYSQEKANFGTFRSDVERISRMLNKQNFAQIIQILDKFIEHLDESEITLSEFENQWLELDAKASSLHNQAMNHKTDIGSERLAIKVTEEPKKLPSPFLFGRWYLSGKYDEDKQKYDSDIRRWKDALMKSDKYGKAEEQLQSVANVLYSSMKQIKDLQEVMSGIKADLIVANKRIKDTNIEARTIGKKLNSTVSVQLNELQIILMDTISEFKRKIQNMLAIESN